MPNYSIYNKAPWYFENTKFKSAVISDGITSIGDYAFYWCSSLTSITIPDSITTIKKCAFSGCINLASVTIPKFVTSIGKDAFLNCNMLASINVDVDNKKYTSIDGMLFNKKKTEILFRPERKR